MTTARCRIVDLDVTRYYHCISRCVRKAFLCGDGFEHRKQWLEDRLEFLASCFAISIAGFAVMDNHFHLLIRVDPDVVSTWSDEEVLRRWMAVYPPKGINWSDEDNVLMWIAHYAQNPKKVAEYRRRLANLGWFMKSLKEPLARMANREDECKGTFWEGRYRSIAILDEEALLTVCAYIDLNPVAAGLTDRPESGQHTSIRQRIEHVKSKDKVNTLKSVKSGSIAASRALGNVEQDHWLIPFEDRRAHTNSKPKSKREGMIEKFTFGHYLELVDFTSRLLREGKARLKRGVQQIFDRLESSVEFWSERIKKMLMAKELRGRCFAGAPNRISKLKLKEFFAKANNLSPMVSS